ncbi:MAG TPA: VWA domain-containing protein [Mycobacteriales bacterium]|nr:VWA domain-containing protein [Mycobacteriales bacterium]
MNALRAPVSPTCSRPPAVPDAYDGVDLVIGLAHTLRAAGVAASPDRVHATIGALALLDPMLQRDVYWAGRLTMCASRDDIDRYDRVFAAYFGDRPAALIRRPTVPAAQLRLVAAEETPTADDAVDDSDEDSTPMAAAASATEVLRHRDIATLDATERAMLARLLAAFALPGEHRVTRRLAPAARGYVDRRRTLLRLMHAGGEPAELARRHRRRRPRRVVLLVDISGSMSSYADALLRFAHAASHRSRGPVTEVFTLGTRLTRVTPEMAQRDSDAALRAIAGAVPDWSGGTRLGELMKRFLDEWGQRGMARGSVVVVLSDGWERGDAALLGEQMARMHRLAHRVIWSNPRAGRPGFAPLAAGMAAALPHVDTFVSGHSLAALERLAVIVAGARARAEARELSAHA